jgi:N-acetylglutamate synthase-like GNAT family acetyltransferase
VFAEEFVVRKKKMIRKCTESDFNRIFEIVNDAAHAYKGIIPEDRWHEPYMPIDELREESENGVFFWGIEHDGQLVGVMGIQDKGEVTLIRHAYVLTAAQKSGIGTKLLKHLESLTEKPVLIGTWAAASWAISFYEKNGYVLVSEKEKNYLLSKYWSIPVRQVETSVVLARETPMLHKKDGKNLTNC